MIARYHGSMKEKDRGFTLIELLVVIVIIGILAAIAIPTFLNQRKKGVDASLKSDLKTAATSVETWVTDNPSVAIDPVASVASASFSTGNTVLVVKSAASIGAYCIFAYNDGASAAIDATHQMAYKSLTGGLQAGVPAGIGCA